MEESQEKTKLKLQAVLANMNTWRKLYNDLCRPCKQKIFLAGCNANQNKVTEGADKMKAALNDLCPRCSLIVEDLKKRGLK